MAFIYLRRSRNTRSYLLIESYRDDRGKTRKRTLCYLGRERDGTDTLEKALAHWQRAGEGLKDEIRRAKGERRAVLRRRLAAAEARIAVIADHLARQRRRAAEADAERQRRQQGIEEAPHWQAIERLRREPSDENAKAAKRAFLWLARRHHPNSGGSHKGFLRLKDAYDRAVAAWR
jgi:chromosome segregation ATPase